MAVHWADMSVNCWVARTAASMAVLMVALMADHSVARMVELLAH